MIGTQALYPVAVTSCVFYMTKLYVGADYSMVVIPQKGLKKQSGLEMQFIVKAVVKLWA